MGLKEAGSLVAVFILAVMVGIFTNYLASQIRIVGGIEGFTSTGENVTRKDVQTIKSFLKYLSFDTVKNEFRINAPGGLFVDNKIQIKEDTGIPLVKRGATHTYKLAPWGIHYNSGR
jgi:hypothetical protein